MSKPRKANFSDSEVKVLLDCVARYKEVLLSKFTNNVSNKKKQAAWDQVTAEVNACGVALRSVGEVKKKWKDVKAAVLREQGEEKKTGGGPAKDVPYKDVVMFIIGDGSDATSGIDVDGTDSYCLEPGWEHLVSMEHFGMMVKADELSAVCRSSTVCSSAICLSSAPCLSAACTSAPCTFVTQQLGDTSAFCPSTTACSSATACSSGVCLPSAPCVPAVSASNAPGTFASQPGDTKPVARRKQKGVRRSSDEQLFNRWLSSSIETNDLKCQMYQAKIAKLDADKQLTDLLIKKTELEIAKLTHDVFHSEQ